MQARLTSPANDLRDVKLREWRLAKSLHPMHAFSGSGLNRTHDSDLHYWNLREGFSGHDVENRVAMVVSRNRSGWDLVGWNPASTWFRWGADFK